MNGGAVPEGRTPGSGASHRAFLDAYYGWAEPIYDVTRRPYLRGRDRALRMILARPFRRLLEIGAGTGRNLELLHRARPDADYAAVEPSAPMRRRLSRRCPWVRVSDELAEDVDPRALFDLARPDVILFSYSLSMMEDPSRVLRRARRALAPDGEVFVVDFGGFGGFPRAMATAFRRWLATFRVHPVARHVLAKERAEIVSGRFDFYRIARIPPVCAPRAIRHDLTA